MIDPTTLTYARVTNLAAGTCNHIDFMVLYLALHGTSRACDVDRAHAAWLGRTAAYRYFAWFIFHRAYGFVSFTFANTANAINLPKYGFGSQPGTLIHNPIRGYYALNINGYLRVARITGHALQ